MGRWFKLETNALSNPKLIKTGAAGMILYVRAIGYAHEHLTDGYLPKEVIRGLVADFEEIGAWREPCRRAVAEQSPRHGVTKSVTPQNGHDDLPVNDRSEGPTQKTLDRRRQRLERLLVEVGLWDKEPDGYRIHDYLHHQSSAAEMRTKEEQAREQARLRKARERTRKKASPGHAELSPSSRKSEHVTHTREEGLSSTYLNPFLDKTVTPDLEDRVPALSEGVADSPGLSPEQIKANQDRSAAILAKLRGQAVLA